ncbi:nesprin-1 [Alosa sapidissima]|uniref:nesprin-1 n=1 Tax=Alosa sapidissima TaxID=34773 RepID=UPI001C08E7AB|nr:nesprin-1 [Alosa sapidissima]
MASPRLRGIAGEVQRLQDEQEAVQKRTFTKWINSHLAKHTPPLVMTDLFEDIRDGVRLLALLEVLSGQKLRCEQGRRLQRIHWVANVRTALNFLEGRWSVYRGSPVKLVNINVTDVVDGRPSIVLGLVWTIILYFQFEELTSGLSALQGQLGSSSSLDSSNSADTTSPSIKRKPRLSFQGGARRALLKWVQCTVTTATKRRGLEVNDFGPSWRSGVAFLTLISALRPELVNMEQVYRRGHRENLQEAFSLAERELGIPRLLDPEDVDVDKPDEKSIMTYVAQFLRKLPNPLGQQQDEEDLVREEGEWRRAAESNSTLTRRQQEAQAQLERTLKLANACLSEKGPPDQLHRKHTEFFARLDQHVLNVFLKACDDLTDILPENEQHALQETVRELHKQWKDVQAEAPLHLLHLRVESERRRLMTSLQKCREELDSNRGSHEHRGQELVCVCEVRLQAIEELCQKLPEGDAAQQVLRESRSALAEVKGRLDHMDTWSERQSVMAQVAKECVSQEDVCVLVDACVSQEDVCVLVDVCVSQEEDVCVLVDACVSQEDVCVLVDACVSQEDVPKEQQDVETSRRVSSESSRRVSAESSRRVSAESSRRVSAESSRRVSAETRQLLLVHQVKDSMQQMKLKLQQQIQLTPLCASPSDTHTALQEVIDGKQSSGQLASRLEALSVGQSGQAERGELEPLEVNLREHQQGAAETLTILEHQQGAAETLTILEELMAAWCRGEGSSRMLNLLQEHQTLKYNLRTILQTAENLTAGYTEPQNREDIRRTLSQHGAVTERMVSAQEELDLLCSRGRLLQMELTKVSGHQAQDVTADTNAVVERWSKVFEIIDGNVERLTQTLVLWDDVVQIEQSIGQWCSSSLPVLCGGLVSLEDMQSTEKHLSAFKLEIDAMDVQLASLHEQLTKLSQRRNNQEVPAELQQVEEGLRRKLCQAHAAYARISRSLEDYSSQKQQLEDFISQGALRLKNVEDKVSDLLLVSNPENISRLKEIKGDLSQQQLSLDEAQAKLSMLHRSHPSQELGHLSEELTDLVRRRDMAALRCSRASSDLQGELQLHISEITQDFHRWLTEQKDNIKDLSDQSEARVKGCPDQSEAWVLMADRLQELKGALECLRVGEERLGSVCEEGGMLLLHLPPSAAGHVEEQLLSCRRAWAAFVEESQQSLQSLEHSAALQHRVEVCVEGLGFWLQQMEQKLEWEELPEGEREQERLEQLHTQLLLRRPSLERVCVDAEVLADGGWPWGQQACVCVQRRLHAVLEGVSTRRRGCLEGLLLGQQIRGIRVWIQQLRNTLHTHQGTQGSRTQLQERLQRVQEVLLLKGEGEVRINMVVGRGGVASRSCGDAAQKVMLAAIQEVEDEWAGLLISAMRQHSRLERALWLWAEHERCRGDQEAWLQAAEVARGVEPQAGLREKQQQREKVRLLVTQLEQRREALTHLEQGSAQLYDITRDPAFSPASQACLKARFDDVRTAADESLRLAGVMVTEHQQYLEAVRELSDWLLAGGEELQRWSDLSGDSASLEKRLEEVRALLLRGVCEGREALRTLRFWSDLAGRHTAARGCEAMEAEGGVLARALDQWEGAALRTRDELQIAMAAASERESERHRRGDGLQHDAERLEEQLLGWREELSRAERKNNSTQAVEGWTVATDILELLHASEPMADRLKEQLDALARCSGPADVRPQLEWVSAIIKQHNSLSLRASRECQSKQKLLDQRFRSALRDFQQWLVNAQISTARCFDAPLNVHEATTSLQKIEEFLNEEEQAQTRLNTVLTCGEHLGQVLGADETQVVREKVTKARDDWESLMTELQSRETALQTLQSQMEDFEARLEPLQHWLKDTEITVQESTARLHDIPGKRQELCKLQAVLKELTSREAGLTQLRGQAYELWEGQAAGRDFMHRVSQLIGQYLALSNLIKEKLSRMERVLAEHQLFSEGLVQLQLWVADAHRTLQECSGPAPNKSLLLHRMGLLEELVCVCAVKEVELKMLITRGECVQRSFPADVRKHIQDLKDSWDALQTHCITCKSDLEGALCQWTSYQEDVGLFISWLERVEGNLVQSSRQHPEMRDKTGTLSRAKLLYEEVLSHCRPLEAITCKASRLSECSRSPAEVQRLSERYGAIKHKAKCAVERAEELVLAHQEYQRALHQFEDWLEQQQERLGQLTSHTHTHSTGELAVLENTLKELQELRCVCSEGPVLLSAVLSCRERVVPWGIPQIESRALEAACVEWEGYQARLGQARVTLDGTVGRVRQLDLRFRSLDEWLDEMDVTATVRNHRRSDRHTKERHLQQLQRCQAEALRYQSEVDGLSILVQEVLQENHVSSQLTNRTSQLCGRYHTLQLKLMGSIQQLQEEICSIEDAHCTAGAFSDWLTTAQRNFGAITSTNEGHDIVAMENKLKRLEALQAELQQGHGILKSLREQAEAAASFLDSSGAERLEGEVEERLSQLEQLSVGLRTKRSALERSLKLHTEFQDRLKAQVQWLEETRVFLSAPVEPKAELYQRKAHLAKYKAVQHALQCRGLAIQSVVERGENLTVVERGDSLHSGAQHSSIKDSLEKLQEDYTDLCTTATALTQKLEVQVLEQEGYLRALQEVECWLLQTSSRMVTPDPSKGRSLDLATQQLARHKAIMEEIAAFEERLSGLQRCGETLVSTCGGGRLRQQVQTHLQGARDSYSAICSTAQRVYQCLDSELQKHMSEQDALLQCQSWVRAVQAELQTTAPTPASLQGALSQVQQHKALEEQAGTYLQMVCSSCDLSDEAVRETATKIQRVRLQVEERLRGSQRVVDEWREVGEQRDELDSRLRDTERRLHSLARSPAQLEPRTARNLLDQAQAFIQELEQQQGELRHLRQTLCRLAGQQGQEDWEVEVEVEEEVGGLEVGGLWRAWLGLGRRAGEVMEQRQQDVQRAAEYQQSSAALDQLFQQVSREWDYLARADTESTSEHLSGLKKLFADLQDQRGLLEDLRESRHAIVPRLSPEDRDLVKEHVEHLENRWALLENLIQQKIQNSASVLKDLGLVEARLREAREWAQEKQPSLAAVGTSPPPDVAQSFLFDHLSVCAELEAKQLLLTQAVGGADELSPRLGLSERRSLQALTLQAQAEVEALGAAVTQRRKHLTKAFTERTQFLQALGRTAKWVRQQEGKALMEEHVALLPDDISRQVDACRAALSSLKAQQGELSSLWGQGRDLVRGSTDEEKAETLEKLQEVQGTFERALGRCTQKLLDLEKALATRKYFKVDLDKMCDWLRQTEALMYPQMDWNMCDAEQQSLITKYQTILEQASEYENLLLIVQRAGQEILPTLNEVDHCYLDEKLNALPQHYNSILVSAKQRLEIAQQTLAERKEFDSLMEVTDEAVRKLQGQFEALEKQTVSCSVDIIPGLHGDFTDLLKGCSTQDRTLKELKRKREELLSVGHPCNAEALNHTLRVHSELKHHLKQKLKDLNQMLTCAGEYSKSASDLASELKAVKEHMSELDTEDQTSDTLSRFHSLAQSLAAAECHLQRLSDLSSAQDPQQLIIWQEELLGLKGRVRDGITSCACLIRDSGNFHTEITNTLGWLKTERDGLLCSINFDELTVEKSDHQLKKILLLQEEVQSKVQIFKALADKERQKHSSHKEQSPATYEGPLGEVMQLEADILQALSTKQSILVQAQPLLQQCHFGLLSAQQWLERAGEFLDQAKQEVDPEDLEDCLRELEDILSQETGLAGGLEMLQDMPAQLEGLEGAALTLNLTTSIWSVCHQGSKVKEQLKSHQQTLQRCAAMWRRYEALRGEIISRMDEAERGMADITTISAVSLQEAHSKLEKHKCLVGTVGSCEGSLAALREQAGELAQVGISARAARLTDCLWKRWTRLSSSARSQERALESTAREWRSFEEKVQKARSVAKDLQGRVPEGAAEKAASRAALQSLLDYHDCFCLEVERERAGLVLLGQLARALTPLPPEAQKGHQDISCLQECYCRLLQRARSGREHVQAELAQREQLEREMSLVKGHVHDTRSLLLSPSADLDTLLIHLEAAHEDVLSHRQKVEHLSEQQQLKYEQLHTHLPPEISTQLAELTLTLAAAEDQVGAREREVQQTRELKEELTERAQELQDRLTSLTSRLTDKSAALQDATEENKCVCEELERCCSALSELRGALEEFGQQNPLLRAQLTVPMATLDHAHSRATALAQDRSAQLLRAEELMEDYTDMRSFIMGWVQKAESLTSCSIVWSPSAQLHEPIRAHQSLVRKWPELQQELEMMGQRVSQLSDVLHTHTMSQQVAALSSHAQQLQDALRNRLDTLQDAAKDVGRLEAKVKTLRGCLEQMQSSLTCPELGHASLRQQLTIRQHLLSEMEDFKQQVEELQQDQSALRLPEEVLLSLPLCHTAHSLHAEGSQLQHSVIQQCNILQEAVLQHEQCEQEVRQLQKLVEEAHRIIQDRPVATGNIQELQTQIQHHEELAQRMQGYQEQISALNSKCRMLTVKAKHATMLLTVSEAGGISDGLEELDPEDDEEEEEEEEMARHPAAHPSVVMMTAGRCHTLLSPVTEESGEEGTPPTCRSPSPGAQGPGKTSMSGAAVQDMFDPVSMETSSAHLDDLQRSWDTLKNVISQMSGYQEALQSVSTKMEAVEAELSEGLDHNKSPESQMASHQALLDEMLLLQDELGALQDCFSEELLTHTHTHTPEEEMGQQRALQSTLTVLAERMATIRMKASGKRQLLEERLSEQLEEQRQEQALQRCHSEAEELDHWLLSTRATLSSALQPHPQDMDMEEQLIDCQNMLLEIEQKVSGLSELSVHSESLLLEGRSHTRGEAEQLSQRLHGLKASLLELQRILQDKQIHIQGSLQEQEDSESDSTLSQSPNFQDWLSQLRNSRGQKRHEHSQRQRELEDQLLEQKKLLQAVASRGEELIMQQATPTEDSLSEELQLPLAPPQRSRWEKLRRELSTKLQLSAATLQQEQQQPTYQRSRVTSPGGVFRAELPAHDGPSPRTLFETFNQAGGSGAQLAGQRGQQLCAAVAATSSWLDSAEAQLLSGPMLLSDHSEAQLCHLEALMQELYEVEAELKRCREALSEEAGLVGGGVGLVGEGVGLVDEGAGLAGEALEMLEERLRLLSSMLGPRCQDMTDRLQELSTFQGEMRQLSSALSDSRIALQQKMIGSLERPASRQMEMVLEAEDSLREFDQRVQELRSRGETLQPDQTSAQELLKLQDCYEELVLMVGCRRGGLHRVLALKVQYEVALQDLAELLDTAQDKVAAEQKMSTRSVMEVQILLDTHKEFFHSLEGHVVLTESWFGRVRGVLSHREQQAHEDTVGQARSTLTQAHRRGMQLEAVLESWGVLVVDYQALCRTLEQVESSIPTTGLLEETEERLHHRISLYQRLKGSLSEQQQQLYRVLDEGKRLLVSVCCSELELQLTQLGDHWLSTSTKLNKELHRLDSTLRHWTRYQSESAVLSQWLRSALERLEFWNTQSVTVPQELETVRDHLHAFLEFSKEVEARSSLYSSVLSVGGQLLRLKKVDTAALRAQMAQVDTQWADLLTRIPLVQEKLHQLQMEKLPSRHAITELMSWISLMENAIQEDQQCIMGAVGSEVIHNFLQKYKGFRIDLTCKQLTVDFVNQSVLQMSSHDVEGKRSDKTDFAERLGAMNRRWQILQGFITEKIQVLEGLLERWAEHESGVQTLGAWLNSQEEKLKRKQRLEDVASVHNALKDCQDLEETLQEKVRELDKAEERGCLLTKDKTGDGCAVVMETLKGLKQSWASLEHMLGQLKGRLRLLLDQWLLHKQASDDITGYIIEGRYSLSRLRRLNGSLDATHAQVESLEALQGELEAQEGSLTQLSSSTQLLHTHSATLTHTLTDVTLRWNGLLEQVSEQLRSGKSLLQLWQRYQELHTHTHTAVQRHEDAAQRLLKNATDGDVTGQELDAWRHKCSDLLADQDSLQAALQEFQEVSDQLRKQVEPCAMATFQADHLSLTQRLATVEHALCRQQSVLQGGVQEVDSLVEQLDALEELCEEAELVLKEAEPEVTATPTPDSIQERMDTLKALLLQLSGWCPDLERLNQLGFRLPLTDVHIKRMQRLNLRWNTHTAHTMEEYSRLQASHLLQLGFQEKCEAWRDFLSSAEQRLATDISGSRHTLLEQQKEHELFQAEMFSRQQILHSIISNGHALLDQGQVEDREDFGLKLALLSHQWQAVVRRAMQRRGLIDGLLHQWEHYHQLLAKLRLRLHQAALQPPDDLQGAPVALQQARNTLDIIQLKERLLQRQQASYVLVVEAGRQLLLSCDSLAEASLQAELSDVQEHWRSATLRLDERKKELNALLKDWERCEKAIAASHEKLRLFKRKLSVPIPDHHDELHTEQIRCKELEGGVEGWPEAVLQLSELKESLSSRLRPHDLSILQERLDLLHSQWDEISHQLRVRRQQVGEKLNEWMLFNEKNKDLCEWLTHMESKVSQNADISIQDMIDKLRKDYHEEIVVMEETRGQLLQMGERLARSSHEGKANDIHYKLSKVNERWQHLLDLMAARVKKLRETLVAVQQLDKNMSVLRSWLAHIETELSRPIVYDTCDAQEIQRKLKQQQELQGDIEKHSTGVASVLNLCEVLLHDCDACASDTECEAIQQATRGLDRRWRNICAVAMERRLKIEETWRLWQKFLDDFGRFEEWLKASERSAALPNSAGVLYTIAKEEQKKFEAFQRQVQECLTQLELINKQYRRLARENRTDASCRLREMVHDGNRRWDNLQRRVASILRRLKHFIGQREEFETNRDSILVWLTEMDLQLTNIEHFSECDVQAKIKQLRAFQQEIGLNAGKMEQVFRQGEGLLSRSEPQDAEVIEDELEELRRYYQEVTGRVERYYRRLTRLPLSEEDFEGSDRELELEEGVDLTDLQWEESTPLRSSSRPPSGPAPPPRTDPCGRDTPASVDSLPLEWDHDYDLEPMGHTISTERGGSPTHKDQQTLIREGTTALTDVVIPESPEAYIRLTEDTLRSSSAEPGQLESQLRQLDRSLDPVCYQPQLTEGAVVRHDPELDSPYMGYMRLMGDCRGSINAVKKAEEELEEDEEDLSGLTNPDSTETQSTGVIKRWELLQAQANLQPWQQLTSDLETMEAWLDDAEAELNQLSGRDFSTDIHTIEQRIKKLKELQRAVDAHKSLVLSINLSSVELAQSESGTGRDLPARLAEMNGRWERLTTSLDEWRTALQDALMQCQEFHELSHGLLLWLENIDRRRNQVVPIATGLDLNTLRTHHHTLTEVQVELQASEQRVVCLQELVEVGGGGGECVEARERVHVIGNRLHTLLRAVTSDLQQLDAQMEAAAAQQGAVSWSVVDEPDASADSAPSSLRTPWGKRGKRSPSPPGAPPNLPHHRWPGGSGCGSSHSERCSSQAVGGAVGRHCQSFFLRVLRAALPLQLLLLLLLALACLVPMSEQDYSCHHANNFARSFHPMLRYTNGPPPI